MTEAIDRNGEGPASEPTSGLTSRRALIAAGLGSAVGLIAAALGRPLPAKAQDGVAALLGLTNTASSTTGISIETFGIDGFTVTASGSQATGVHGKATGVIGTGIHGEATAASGYGVYAEAPNGTGVRGVSESGHGVEGQSSQDYGVVGRTSAAAFAGVAGFGSGGGYGVEGDSSTSIGVLGTSASSIGVSGVSTSWIGVAGSSGSSYAVYGEANGSGAGAIGVHGTSAAGVGMLGKSRAASQPGSVGWSGGNSTGIQGFSNDNSANPPAPRAKTGVFGQATQDSSSRGVVGVSSSGSGVRGEASTGIAVQGVASNVAGYAIRGSGRVRFDKVSGVATIPAGSTSVTVTPGTDVTADSFLLLTAKTNISTRSLYFTTDTTNNRFTIRMSSSRTSSTQIAWLLLS